MGLEQDILNEPVSSLPLRDPIVVTAMTTVGEAVDLMRGRGLGCVVVVNDELEPAGKFTERILIDLLLSDPDALKRTVGEYMAAVWDRVRLDDPIALVIEKMQAHDLRFVIVVDDHGKTVGLTGQRGVAEYIADYFPHDIKTSRAGSSPAIQNREGA